MQNRNFNQWLSTFTDSIASWNYYSDFPKIFDNVDKIKIELNILNSLIGSKTIEKDFRELIASYPQVLKCIPILLAKREMEIVIKSPEQDYYYKFNEMNYSIDDYCLFMHKTGLFDLLSNHIISNLCDYVTGVESGLDTNARKNRTGHSMENLVEEFIIKAGFTKDISYFKEMYKSDIESKWNINLDSISNQGKTEKRFDFVLKTEKTIYAIEVNFYSGGGSKLNETARSYKNLCDEAKSINGFSFVWITDGLGWNLARKNLEETFDTLDHLYNINDLKNDILTTIIKG